MLPKVRKLTKDGKERAVPVSWSDSMRNQFIEAMKVAAKGTTCSTGFKTEEWTSITNDFNIRMEMTLTRQQLQNQHTVMKAGYSLFHSYSTQSGFGIDNQTGLVTAEPAAMREYFHAHPKAKEYEFKTLMFYESLHELFSGKVATGKYAVVFTTPPARNLSAAAIGQKRTACDAFDRAPVDEDSDSCDSEEDRQIESGPRRNEKPAAAKEVATPAMKEKSLKEKPMQSVTRLLSTIVTNQKVILDRLPTAVKAFEADFAEDLTIAQKIRVKMYLGKENNSEIFLLMSALEKSETIAEIIQ